MHYQTDCSIELEEMLADWPKRAKRGQAQTRNGVKDDCAEMGLSGRQAPLNSANSRTQPGSEARRVRPRDRCPCWCRRLAHFAARSLVFRPCHLYRPWRPDQQSSSGHSRGCPKKTVSSPRREHPPIHHLQKLALLSPPQSGNWSLTLRSPICLRSQLFHDLARAMPPGCLAWNRETPVRMPVARTPSGVREERKR